MTKPATTTIEVWKPVIGWEGWYEVSSEGRVRRVRPRSDSKVSWPIGRPLRPHIKLQYPEVHLCRSKDLWRVYIHVLVAAAFLGPRPDGYAIDHIDGCKTNNRPINLEYVTSLENDRRAAALGLKARGERIGNARMTAETVREARALYATGKWSQQALGLKYGMTQTGICRILLRQNWKHVT